MQDVRFADDVYNPYIYESGYMQEERYADDYYIPFNYESEYMQEERYAEDDYVPFNSESGYMQEERYAEDDYIPYNSESGNYDDESMLDDFTDSSSAAGSSNSFRSRDWKFESQNVLMQAYTKYKSEFTRCPDFEKQRVWRKIADEVRQKCSITCSDMQCCDRIQRLKTTYEKNKMKRWVNQGSAFMKEARKAFETTGNLGLAPTRDSSVRGPSCSKKFNKAPNKYANRKMRIKQLSLLSAYAKHKGELSQPDVDEEAVWNVIADEVRDRNCLGCDGEMCRNKLEELRCEYEKLKDKEIKNRPQAKFMDEARKAFETAENTVNSPAEESSKVLLEPAGKKNRRYLLLLLQLYGQYKTKPASPELEEEGLWKKIAAELKEKFLYDCTDALCRFDVIKLKSDYEKVKRNPPKDNSFPYYYNEAQQVFETAGFRNNQVYISDRNASRFYIPHAAVQGNVQEENVVVKVSNLPRQFGQSELQQIFRQCGHFARMHIPRDQYSYCKGFAFIRFRTQNQARRALDYDGYVYNNVRLRVELADPSEMGDF